MCRKTEILNFFTRSDGKINVNRVKQYTESEIHQEFISLTPYLDNRSFMDRLVIVKKSLSHNPKCSVCEIEVHVNRDVIYDTCGPVCAGIAKRGIKLCIDDDTKENAKIKRKSTMVKKYGTEYNSQREDVKSKLGVHCSTTDFKTMISDKLKSKYIDKFDMIKADDVEWIREQNKTKSIPEISSIVGCSPSKLLQTLNKHGYTADYVYSSYPESLIKDMLDDMCIEYEQHNRTVLGNKELDFYIKSMNIAIEVNGTYWHSEKHIPKNYHIDKTLACENKGIQLLHFWDFEILQKTNIVKSIIRAKMNKCKKIYARKCTVKDVSYNDAAMFITSNHIQGFATSSIRKGLYYNDELVALATFAKPRFYKEYDLELIRFCNKLDYSVVGGVSRLISKIEDSTIVSYANRRFSMGDVYKKSGWTHIKNTTLGFIYVKNSEVIDEFEIASRYSKKESLETMRNSGWSRAWDCGNKVYVKNKKEL